MNTKYIIQRIIEETSFWDLDCWKYFRNVENPNYWSIRDDYNNQSMGFYEWKLDLILKFNRKYARYK